MKIRENSGKENHQFITAEEFAIYTGISLDQIHNCIAD